eukprot:gene8935-9858_t
MAPCCAAAMGAFEAAVISAGGKSQDGIQGVLTYLSSSFQWGIHFEKYLCHMLQFPNDLDCGAMTALALRALKIWKNHHHQSTSFSSIPDSSAFDNLAFASVQLIKVGNRRDNALTEQTVQREYGANAHLYTHWLRERATYHQCIGIYSQISRHLRVWDYGKWIMCPSQIGCLDSVLAVRINPVHAKQINEYVMWDGKLRLPIMEWLNIPRALGLEEHCNCVGNSEEVSLTPKQLIVFISGCNMGNNPMPGVGTARCLKAWFKEQKKSNMEDNLLLVGIDDAEGNPMSGLQDPVFDDIVHLSCYRKLASGYLPTIEAPLYRLGNFNHIEELREDELAEEQLWESIMMMVNEPSRIIALPSDCSFDSFILPCSDSDVYFLSAKKSALQRALSSLKDCDLKENKMSLYRNTCQRILCPDQAVIALVQKPIIEGAVGMGCFAIPDYLIVEMMDRPLVEVLQDINKFCEQVSFPVLLKTSVNKAKVCIDWNTLLQELFHFLSHDQNGQIFIQQYIQGQEKTIAFAAVSGELTGCVQIRKINLTYGGKVWSARVEAVEESFIPTLAYFVRSSNWTGGGELEFIEVLAEGLDDKKNKWYIIDFNPRFPAWIFGGSLAGCNLPGDLIEHALLYRKEGKGRWSYEKYASVLPISFTRSVYEQEVKHIEIPITASLSNLGSCSTTKAINRGCSSSSSSIAHEEVVLSFHNLSATKENGAIEYPNEAINSLLSSDNSELDRNRLSKQWWEVALESTDHLLSDYEARQGSLLTPTYLISSELATRSLESYDQLFKTMLTNVSNSAPSLPLAIQLHISVKTQPHRLLLSQARDRGYGAECISMAEVGAALDVGYQPNQILLVGPGKFWEGKTPSARSVLNNYKCQRDGLRLKAIFADSIGDLKTILRRINDPNDYLRAGVVGVRFQPPDSSNQSRFGIDGSNPQVILAVASLLRDHLPQGVKFGGQVHFASSAPGMGSRKWKSIARGAWALAQRIAVLSGKVLEVMDFGGGWQPNVLEAETVAQHEMQHLLADCLVEHAKIGDHTLTIFYELGKCISEPIASVLCRVLEVRELDVTRAPIPCNGEKGTCRAISRAIIVDASIAEISIPHIHPIFWRPHTSSNKKAESQWLKLERLGEDEIWGRTCMEFDILVGKTNGWMNGAGVGSCGLGSSGLMLPCEIQSGDWILIGGCGAYDMTMQYDFGNGQGREWNSIVVA